MNTQSLENPNDFPVEAFSALLNTSPDQQEMLRLYMECSDEVQTVVRDMFVVLTSDNATPEERHRACTTIAHALHPISTKGHGSFGVDLAQIEKETASKHPDETKRPLIAQRLEQMDSQESSFSVRLRELIQKRNITQQELAERADCTQSAISKMLTRNCRPQKKTIFKLAAALTVEPTELWPDLEVAAILDSVARFQQEQELAPEHADAIEESSKRPPSKIKGRRLPSRKGK